LNKEKTIVEVGSKFKRVRKSMRYEILNFKKEV